MPGPVLDAREAGTNRKARQGPCFQGTYILAGQHIINIISQLDNFSLCILGARKRLHWSNIGW